MPYQRSVQPQPPVVYLLVQHKASSPKVGQMHFPQKVGMATATSGVFSKLWTSTKQALLADLCNVPLSLKLAVIAPLRFLKD